jgi:hypothetical protein
MFTQTSGKVLINTFALNELPVKVTSSKAVRVDVAFMIQEKLAKFLIRLKEDAAAHRFKAALETYRKPAV